MSDPWFRPKSMGFGYTPANAKGWLALLLFVALVIATVTLLGEPVSSKSPDVAAEIGRVRDMLGLGGVNLSMPARFGLIGAEIVVFFIFAQSKSGPPPQALD